ncbi:restriction endonuclease subunit S [Aeromonas veronii]|uniref:restriction endonuclease subunit S n=1 Tax=Aeromonas veronii TaxID=654 RepID=UPI001318094A|nr:restriction endonuclease subunit S [Aeromonas veronii]QHC07815.1 restriction endonuclease subunit S [Aeromonas veronii]
MKLPDSWHKSPLGELFKKIVVGYVGNVNDHYCDASRGVPFYRTLNIRDGYFRHDEIRHVTKEFNDKNKKSQIENDDIVIARVGANLGMVCKVSGLNGMANMANAIIIKNKSAKNASSDFYTYFLLSPYGKSQIYAGAAGGAQGVFNTKLTQEISVPVPPLPEQKKIAKILSTWDKAITTTEQLLANSQQQKKALMQQLLTGKKRLLDNNGVRFSGEWKFQSISQISKRIQRKSDGEGHPILTISSLSGFVRQDERYSRYMAGESVKNYILLKKGEFAYNKGNSKTYEFGCIFDLDSYKSGLVPHVYVCFKLHQGLSHRYFKYLFEADYLKPQLGALVNTGVRNNGLLNIKPSEFMNAKVPVPCFDEQEQIADVLHASSETINKLQLKLDALKQEKKALMQQLLTGKRRVQL